MTPEAHKHDAYLSSNPTVVRRLGGWFATGVSWSGPWRTERAAQLALEGKFDEANALERSR